MSNSTLSRHYYELLVDISEQIYKINAELTEDKAFIEKYKIGLPDAGAASIINYCILYDLGQVVNKITAGIHKESLEAAGLALACNRIVEGAQTDILANGYEKVSGIFHTGAYHKTAEAYVRIVSGGNPVRLSAGDLGDTSREATEVVPTYFSLPGALQHMKHHLFDEYAAMLFRFANIIAKADGQVTADEEILLKEIYHDIHHPFIHIQPAHVISNPAEIKPSTINEIVNELEELIGLTEVKEEIKTMINFMKVQKSREAQGLKNSDVSYHIVFTGNPGTGKTTVARIVAKVYKALSILTGGQLIETDRSGLVAEYVGQTAAKVNKVVDTALNGILFIDEAYSLAGNTTQDYGKEAIATLVKRMEDDRDKLVVIAAGYTQEMKDFIDSNPGLRSRFNRYIEFPDYTPDELFSIFVSFCVKADYLPTPAASRRLKEIFTEAYQNRDRSFGNGRYVRNIFEKVLEAQANRIAGIGKMTREVLTGIEEEDVEEGKN